jgi:3'-phosphoadenosine 5'-phosphosulfate sulfotransferase (PAPS reductase)/FAD synthetase
MRHNIVSVSGGKDSTALLLLAIERETQNLSAVFADTGNEHETTYMYIEYLNREVLPIRTVKADFTDQIAKKADFVRKNWANHGISEEKIKRALEVLKPTGNPFLDMCICKGRMPSSKARFCTLDLKRNPIIEQVYFPILSDGHEIYSWQGVRRDESRARADLSEIEAVGGGLFNYRPILDWKAADCFAMHKKHGIAHNPLYQKGMGRVGCMPCINCRKDELYQISQRFPEVIERIAEWEKIVKEASKCDGATFFYNQRGDDIHEAVMWSKTTHGGKHFDLLKVADDGDSCSSIYGLCE